MEFQELNVGFKELVEEEVGADDDELDAVVVQIQFVNEFEKDLDVVV